MTFIIEMKPDSVRDWVAIAECSTQEQAQTFIDSELEEVAGEYRIVKVIETGSVVKRGKRVRQLSAL